jgi:hypothetical protein
MSLSPHNFRDIEDKWDIEDKLELVIKNEFLEVPNR